MCQRLKLHKEALLHSLEVASLAASLRGSGAADTQAAAPGLFDADQARGLASAALLGLLSGPQDHKSSLKKLPAQLQPQQQQQQQQQPEGQQLQGHQAEPQAQAQQRPEDGQVPAAGSPSSSSSWEYEVQQLDLAAVLQRASGSKEDASTSRAVNVAEVLLM